MNDPTLQAPTTIRRFLPGDHFAIAEIFTQAVHEIASEVYSPEQCLAWSAREANPDHWQKRCERKQPWVAVSESKIAGFLELDPDGHIDCAYIYPPFQRRGIMTRLVQHAVSQCAALRLSRVYVEASLCARPLFEKQGFTTLEQTTVVIQGVPLVNYRMEKFVSPSCTV